MIRQWKIRPLIHDFLHLMYFTKVDKINEKILRVNAFLTRILVGNAILARFFEEPLSFQGLQGIHFKQNLANCFLGEHYQGESHFSIRLDCIQYQNGF